MPNLECCLRRLRAGGPGEEAVVHPEALKAADRVEVVEVWRRSWVAAPVVEGAVLVPGLQSFPGW